MYAISFVLPIVAVITLVYLLVAMWRSASILLNYRMVRKTREDSLVWPSVTGKVASSNVEEVVWYSRTSGNSSMYHPSINYLYTVKGREYDGNRVRFASNIGTPNRKEAYDLTKRYPENASLEVFYDPHNPADSVIERELTNHYRKAVSRETAKLIVGIVIFALVGLYIVTSIV